MDLLGLACLETGRSGRKQAVVWVPLQGGDRRLDRLLYVLRHPPVVLLKEQKQRSLVKFHDVRQLLSFKRICSYLVTIYPERFFNLQKIISHNIRIVKCEENSKRFKFHFIAKLVSIN